MKRAVYSACLSDRDLSDSVGPGTWIPPHVVECGACRARREVFAADAALLREQPLPVVSDERLALIRAAVLDAVEPAPPHRSIAGWALAVAAIALLTAGAAWWWAGTRAADPGQGARAMVESSDGAQLEHQLSPGDEVVRLHRGRVRLRVAKLRGGERFRVVTADGEVEVRGTVFDVEVEQGRLSWVAVTEGLVVVRRIGQAAVWLEAGQQWRREEATALSAADGAVSSPIPTVADRPAQRVRPRSVAAAPDAGMPAPVVVPQADAAVADAHTASLTPPIPAGPDGGPVGPVTDLVAAESHFARGWDLLPRARARAAAHFAEAETLAGSDALAEDAGYWRAIALHEDDDAEAVAALQLYITRYPSSPRWAAVALVLARRWIEAEQPDPARRLLERVARHRDVARAREAEALLERLAH